MENDGVRYDLIFELETTENLSRTRIEKSFKQWMGTEFETIMMEVRYALIACGYSEALVDKYITNLD